MLLDDERVLVAPQVDVGREALNPRLAVEAFGQMAVQQLLAQEHLAVRAQDVALVEPEIVPVPLRLLRVHRGRPVQGADAGIEAGAHLDQEMPGVGADMVVLARDEIPHRLEQHLLGERAQQPDRRVAIVAVAFVSPRVEVVRLGLPRMAVVAERVQVVELLVVEPRAAQGAVHRSHHEGRRPVNGGIHRDQEAVGVMEMAQPLAVDAVAGIGQDGAAVPPFVDRPASRAFGEVVFVGQFEVLAGQAELPSDEAWEAAQHAAAGFRRGLHSLCRALREDVEG